MSGGFKVQSLWGVEGEGGKEEREGRELSFLTAWRSRPGGCGTVCHMAGGLRGCVEGVAGVTHNAGCYWRVHRCPGGRGVGHH